MNDTHKKWGVALFVLYLFQISLGGLIHFYKMPFAQIHRRSFQNYFHAAFGIFIITAAFYQVHILSLNVTIHSLHAAACRMLRCALGLGWNGRRTLGEASATEPALPGSFGWL